MKITPLPSPGTSIQAQVSPIEIEEDVNSGVDTRHPHFVGMNGGRAAMINVCTWLEADETSRSQKCPLIANS
jgi:hypothetical protein